MPVRNGSAEDRSGSVRRGSSRRRHRRRRRTSRSTRLLLRARRGVQDVDAVDLEDRRCSTAWSPHHSLYRTIVEADEWFGPRSIRSPMPPGSRGEQPDPGVAAHERLEVQVVRRGSRRARSRTRSASAARPQNGPHDPSPLQRERGVGLLVEPDAGRAVDLVDLRAAASKPVFCGKAIARPESRCRRRSLGHDVGGRRLLVREERVDLLERLDRRHDLRVRLVREVQVRRADDLARRAALAPDREGRNAAGRRRGGRAVEVHVVRDLRGPLRISC